MKNLKFVFVMLIFLMPGCLEDLRDDISSCENITGACRYEILQASKYSRLHIEINYVTDNAPDSDAINLLKQGLKKLLILCVQPKLQVSIGIELLMSQAILYL